MSVLLITAGFLALVATAGSLLWQWFAWHGLDEEARSEQRAIKDADATLHRAERAHRKAVRQADRTLAQAKAAPKRGRYAELVLHDDHVAVGGARYPLTTKTKARVHGHGRGDNRHVMVLLEDPSWSRSLSAKKIGKPHELSAQQFVAEARVLAAQASDTRAAREAATQTAQAELARTRGDTADVDAARAARTALGERHRGAGHPPGKRWRWAATLAALVALVVGGAMTPTNAATNADLAAAPTATSTASPTPAAPPNRSALRAQARKLIARGHYSGAIRAVSDLSTEDARYVERLASSRAASVAERALRRGDRSAAHRALLAVRGFSRTGSVALAERHYKAANAAASRARAQRRAATREAAAARQAERRALQAEEQTTRSSGATNYPGMTCSEIGHSFSVLPGSDPEHDADNDGQACESQ